MVSAFLAKGPRAELEQLIRLRHLTSDIKLFPVTRSRSQYSGGYHSRLRGRGMDFEEVRLYQPGDDIRNIDWRVTARTAKTHTKIFKEEKDRPVIIAVDQSSSLFFGSQVTYKSVMAAQLAALLAWAGLQQNDKVGGIVFNNTSHHEIKPLRNKNAVLRLLEKIVEFNHELFSNDAETISQMNFSQMLETLRHIAKPGSAIFLISDFINFDENSERLLHLIQRHTDVYALIVADPLEQTLPPRGTFSVTDGMDKFRFNSQDQLISRNYRDAFEKRISNLEKRFQKLNVAHMIVWTNDNPRNQIMQLAHR